MSYETDLENLKTAYANLLIAQYNGLEKATATIKLYTELLLANMILWKIRDSFDVETAVGVQLDIIGKWVGVDRYFKGQADIAPHLAFIDWNEVSEPTSQQLGLRNWNETRVTDGNLLNYDEVVSITNALNDNDFRILVKLKIGKNNTIMTCKNIDDVVYNLFGTEVFTTWKNIPTPRLAFYDWNSTDEPTSLQSGLMDWDNMRATDGALLDYDEIGDIMEVVYNFNKSHRAIIELAKEKNCLPRTTGIKVKLQEYS